MSGKYTDDVGQYTHQPQYSYLFVACHFCETVSSPKSRDKAWLITLAHSQYFPY